MAGQMSCLAAVLHYLTSWLIYGQGQEMSQQKRWMLWYSSGIRTKYSFLTQNSSQCIISLRAVEMMWVFMAQQQRTTKVTQKRIRPISYGLISAVPCTCSCSRAQFLSCSHLGFQTPVVISLTLVGQFLIYPGGRELNWVLHIPGEPSCGIWAAGSCWRRGQRQ